MLDLPITLLYFPARFFWFPLRVEVAPGDSWIVEETLENAARPFMHLSDRELLELGFDGRLSGREGKLELRDLSNSSRP